MTFGGRATCVLFVSWLVAFAGARDAAAGDRYVLQLTGDDGVNVNGSPFTRVEKHENTFIIQATPDYAVLNLVKTFEARQASGDAAMKQQMAVQIAALKARQDAYHRAVERNVARTAEQLAEVELRLGELTSSIDEISHDQAELWTFAMAMMVEINRIAARQDDFDARLSPLERERLKRAIAEADIEAATAIYSHVAFERRHDRKTARMNVGIARVGDAGIGDAGTAGYARVHWPLLAHARRGFGIGLTGGASFTVGSAAIAGDKAFFAEGAAQVGPWLRLGGATNLLLETQLDAPLYMYVAGTSRYPLLGAGARLGLTHEPGSIGVFYRRSFGDVIADAPDVTSAGVSISLIQSEYGPSPFATSSKRRDGALSLLFGMMSDGTFPSGGLRVTGRIFNDTTYYPSSPGVGIGTGFYLGLSLGQLHKESGGQFLTAITLAMPVHLRLGAGRSRLHLAAGIDADLVAYTGEDWKWFLPGMNCELRLFGGLSATYRYVVASWRDEALGDYSTLMFGFNRVLAVGGPDPD
jgi:hypothetical protein